MQSTVDELSFLLMLIIVHHRRTIKPPAESRRPAALRSHRAFRRSGAGDDVFNGSNNYGAIPIHPVAHGLSFGANLPSYLRIVRSFGAVHPAPGLPLILPLAVGTRAMPAVICWSDWTNETKAQLKGTCHVRSYCCRSHLDSYCRCLRSGSSP